MPNTIDVRPPRVFISHAGPDRPAADELDRNLRRHGIETFVDVHDVRLGDNVILAIHRELTQSDYFVLLWSRHCDGNINVEREFAAALARELVERRVFLFIVRLDDSDPPGLLAPRLHLDASTGWSAVVARLVRTWRDDRAVRLRVLPALHPVEDGAGPNIVVYIRNRSLSVAHLLPVPGTCLGRELDELVYSGLALPESVAEFDGRTGIRFHYRLLFAEQPIPPHSTLTRAGIVHHSTIDLEVGLEFFVHTGPAKNGVILRKSKFHAPDDPTPNPAPTTVPTPTLAPATIRTLVRKGFAHLTPWPEPARSRI